MWFADTEYESRLDRIQAWMAAESLDWLIVFEPEDVTYVTGFFTDGYNTSFQAALVPAEGTPVSIVREAEAYWFRSARWPARVSWWRDGDTPAEAVRKALVEHAVAGRVGFDGYSWRCPYQVIDELIRTWAAGDLIDIDRGVFRFRLLKSAAEIALMKQAGTIVNEMLERAEAVIVPGMTERELGAELAYTAIASGSDWSRPGPIASGERARHLHASYSDRVMNTGDLVFLEVTPYVKTYHARAMRTGTIGGASGEYRELFETLKTIQDEALAMVRPGVSARRVDGFIRHAMAEAGLTEDYVNKTFYSIGSMLPPNSWEPLEVTPVSDFDFEAGMTFHAYLRWDGVHLSESIAVTDTGIDYLTTFPRRPLNI